MYSVLIADDEAEVVELVKLYLETGNTSCCNYPLCIS